MSTVRGVQGQSVFTSSERLTGQLKINEIREVGELVTETETNAPNIGKLVRKIEMGDPLARKLIKKVETGDRKVGELVKKVQIWKLGRRDQGNTRSQSRMRCWQELVMRTSSSGASTTSLERSCHGRL